MSELIAISIVSSDAQAEFGSLQTIDLDRFKHDAGAAIRTSGVTRWSICGVDLSWNDQIQKGLGAFWQYQLYGIASVYDRDVLFDSLRLAFGRCITVAKPVEFYDFDGSALGASYVLKSQFWRRTSYWDRHADRPCWQTSYSALKAKQAVELALAFDTMGLGARVSSFHLRTSPNTNRFRIRSSQVIQMPQQETD